MRLSNVYWTGNGWSENPDDAEEFIDGKQAEAEAAKHDGEALPMPGKRGGNYCDCCARGAGSREPLSFRLNFLTLLRQQFLVRTCCIHHE